MGKYIYFAIFLFLNTAFFGKASDNFRYIYVGDVPVKISGQNVDYTPLPSEEETLKIPLKRAGNLFLIECRIDTLVGNFILDLGAPYLVLNSTYFRNYTIDKRHYSVSLVDKKDYVRRIKVDKLDIQGVKYSNLSADVTDLGNIENQRNTRIFGLLGVALFKSYVFDLDMFNKQLILHKKKPKKERITGKKMFQIPIRIQNNAIHLKAKAGTVSVNLSLDTGAETNVMANNLSKKAYQGMQVVKTSILQGSSNGKTEALSVFMNDVYVGAWQFKRMYTLILNLRTINRAYGRQVDGILGYPFFTYGRVLIDFQAKELSMYQTLSK